MNAAPLVADAELPHYVSAREVEGDTMAAAVSLTGLLEPAAPRSWWSRIFARSQPPPSETEIATRLLCAWTLGKGSEADPVLQGAAVLTARELVRLTGGR